jgi:SNF2 family DNA or RNA helicase
MRKYLEDRSSVKQLSLSDLQPSGMVGKDRHPTVKSRGEAPKPLSFAMESSADANIDDLSLPDEIKRKLFRHQKYGLRWMSNLHDTHPGGILGDGTPG